VSAAAAAVSAAAVGLAAVADLVASPKWF
jgi:hypothetical protein